MPQNQPDHGTAHSWQRLRELALTIFRAVQPPPSKMPEMTADPPGTAQGFGVSRRILPPWSAGEWRLPAWLAVQLSEK